MTSECGVDRMVRKYDKQELLKIRAYARTDGDFVGRIDRLTGVKGPTNSIKDKSTSKSSTNAVSHARSSSVITNPYEGFEPPPNDDFYFRNQARWSPTASIRGRKVRAFVEQHGSPPGWRVTCGGKVVADGKVVVDGRSVFPFSPTNSKKTVSLFNSAILRHNDLSALHGCLVDVGDGRICQIINGHPILVNINNGSLDLHMPVPNEQVTGPVPLNGYGQRHTAMHQQPTNPSAFVPHASPQTFPVPPFIDQLPLRQQIPALQEFRLKLEADLREHNRKDALIPDNSLKNREWVVGRRVELTNHIDYVRLMTNGLIAQSDAHHGYAQALAHYSAQIAPGFSGPQPFYSHAPPTPMGYGHGGMTMPNGPPTPNSSGMPARPFSNGIALPGGPMMTHPAFMAPSPYNGSLNPSADYTYGVTSVAKNTDAGSQGLGVQYPPSASRFQPGAPDFVPVAQRNASVPHAAPYQLQERSRNVGPPALRSDVDADRKALDSIRRNTAAINLDGSGHLPRQSHAVEIKKPNEIAHDQQKLPSTRFIASSHSGRSAADYNRGDRTNYKQVGGNAASSGHDLSPPGRDHHTCAGTPALFGQSAAAPNGHSFGSNSTSSSVQTADFFPNDPGEHSLRNLSSGTHADLSGWLPKAGESSVPGQRVTPVKPISKFSFGEDSPTDESALRGAARDVVAQRPQIPQASRSLASLRQGASVHLQDLVASPEKSASYEAGYRVGIVMEIASPSDATSDYLEGYRDGVATAARQQDQRSPSADRLPLSAGRVSSNGPKVPVNTALSTPLRRSFTGSALDDLSGPTAASDGRRVLTRPSFGSASKSLPMPSDENQASVFHIPGHDPIWTSPLANRRASNHAQVTPGGTRIFSAPKVCTSIAPSNQHVNGRFISQLDGSNDDDDKEVLGLVPTNATATIEGTSADGKGKQKAPGSPMKRASSRASSAVRHLTSLGGFKKDKAEDMSQGPLYSGKAKKEDDPSNMSSPEKAKWKGKWQRRFLDLKREEQAEEDEYMRRNPVH